MLCVKVVFKVSLSSYERETKSCAADVQSAVAVSSYQNFAVAAESVEQQRPQLLPTHTVGRDRTHMARPYVLHPGWRVGDRGRVRGCQEHSPGQLSVSKVAHTYHFVLLKCN